MAAKRRSTRRRVGRFVREWLVFAPIGIWIAIVVSGFTGRDLLTPQVQSGGLITFGLSFFLAFYDDLPTSEWEDKGGIWGALPILLDALYWVLIGLALIGIPVVFDNEANHFTTTSTLQFFMTAFGLAIVAIGLLVGIGGLATRIRKGHH